MLVSILAITFVLRLSTNSDCYVQTINLSFAWWWPLSHPTVSLKFVFMWIVNNLNHFIGALVFSKVWFVTIPFHNLHEQDGQAQPNQWMYYDQKIQVSRLLFTWFNSAGFLWIWPPTSIKRFCSCMWHCWNVNQHFRNWDTTPFKKSCQIQSASIIEASGKVQVSWAYIHEWCKLRWKLCIIQSP